MVKYEVDVVHHGLGEAVGVVGVNRLVRGQQELITQEGQLGEGSRDRSHTEVLLSEVEDLVLEGLSPVTRSIVECSKVSLVSAHQSADLVVAKVVPFLEPRREGLGLWVAECEGFTAVKRSFIVGGYLGLRRLNHN